MGPIASLIAFSFAASSLAAENPTKVVHCSARVWAGVSLSRLAAGFQTDVDRIRYGETIYIFEPVIGGIAKVVFGNETTEGLVVNRYDRAQPYTVLVYVFGGVAMMDTVFDTGLVVNQLTKASMGEIPMASTFYADCDPAK